MWTLLKKGEFWLREDTRLILRGSRFAVCCVLLCVGQQKTLALSSDVYHFAFCDQLNNTCTSKTLDICEFAWLQLNGCKMLLIKFKEVEKSSITYLCKKIRPLPVLLWIGLHSQNGFWTPNFLMRFYWIFLPNWATENCYTDAIHLRQTCVTINCSDCWNSKQPYHRTVYKKSFTV